ncbi:unnamed protein product [Diamesa tonsa]
MKVLLIVCLTLVAVVAAVPRNDKKRDLTKDENDFIQNYRAKYRKNIKYSNPDEDRKRADIVLERSANITNQNELFNNGKSSFKCGLNHYSYMAFNEFNEVLCGTRPPKESRTSPALPQIMSMVYPPVPAANALALNWTASLCLPVQDQLGCGSCWAFASATIIESMIKKQIYGGFYTPLSPQQLVDCSKESPNNGCGGGWPSVALEHYKSFGVATNATYMYNGIANPTCNIAQANKFPGGIIKKVTQEYVNGNETKLMEILNYAGPVIVVINVCPGFQTLASGIYDNPACPNNTFNHAVVLVGYGVENGIPYWIIRNSWGTWWGEQGYGKMIRNKNNQCGIALYATYASYL